MEIVEKKPVPIYEMECRECGSRFRFVASEVTLSSIDCPVCKVSNFVVRSEPVAHEEV